MKIFKWLSLMAAIFAITIVIVKQYEEISNQENMLTLSSKMGENKPIR